MTSPEFNCLPTAIGAMPHTDPAAACVAVSHYLQDIPAWPQLPHRTFRENMYVQFAEGFPGITITDDQVYVDRSVDLDTPLEQLYTAYLDEDAGRYPLGADYAAGLHAFTGLTDLAPLGVKGQVTGPVSWGLTITDNEGRSVIYDDTLGDAAARLLRLKASWQEAELSKISPRTIIFVDEPYMAAYGSAFMAVSKEKVTALLEEVFRGIAGLKGVHCCGNTDWSLLLDTSADIISFDTYGYAPSLSLYPAAVKTFLERQGVIAWGIVPNEEAALARESVASLKDRLEEAMAPFTHHGVPFRQLIRQGLLTPACGLALMSVDGATQALGLLAGLSAEIRKRYL